MSTIRIFSKKSFAIGPGANRDGTAIESFVTVPGAFQDLPEKYTEDPTFKLAVKWGDIQIVNAVPSVNIPFVAKEAEFTDKPQKEDEIEKFYNELKGKNRDETEELAKKYGGDDSPSFVNGILGKLVK